MPTLLYFGLNEQTLMLDFLAASQNLARPQRGRQKLILLELRHLNVAMSGTQHSSSAVEPDI
jgi:hypothetical protein